MKWPREAKIAGKSDLHNVLIFPPVSCVEMAQHPLDVVQIGAQFLSNY
jgi:hypothetical protein